MSDSPRIVRSGYVRALTDEEAARRDPAWQEAYRASLPRPRDNAAWLLEVAGRLAALERRPWCVCRDEGGLPVAVAWADATEEQRRHGVRVEGSQ